MRDTIKAYVDLLTDTIKAYLDLLTDTIKTYLDLLTDTIKAYLNFLINGSYLHYLFKVIVYFISVSTWQYVQSLFRVHGLAQSYKCWCVVDHHLGMTPTGIQLIELDKNVLKYIIE